MTADPYSDNGVFADVIDGGPGMDILDDYHYAGEARYAPPISVVLDGAANDGRSGEGDNVTGIEVLRSGSAGSFTGDDGDNEFVAPEIGAAGHLDGRGGNDRLIAGDANGDEVLGGAGDDEIAGGFGDDHLVGGPGRDTISGDRPLRCNELHCDYAGFGNDTIDARDGEADSIDCGAGTDTVLADAVDTVAPDCEDVRVAGAGPTQPSGPGTTPAACKVPRVKGLTLGKARKAVKKSGCARAVKVKRVRSKVRKGHVVKAALKHGKLTLTVSKGRR
jgi:hypothetical protein